MSQSYDVINAYSISPLSEDQLQEFAQIVSELDPSKRQAVIDGLQESIAAMRLVGLGDHPRIRLLLQKFEALIEIVLRTVPAAPADPLRS
jgi:hypothetical protein